MPCSAGQGPAASPGGDPDQRSGSGTGTVHQGRPAHLGGASLTSWSITVSMLLDCDDSPTIAEHSPHGPQFAQFNVCFWVSSKGLSTDSNIVQLALGPVMRNQPPTHGKHHRLHFQLHRHASCVLSTIFRGCH